MKITNYGDISKVEFDSKQECHSYFKSLPIGSICGNFVKIREDYWETLEDFKSSWFIPTVSQDQLRKENNGRSKIQRFSN